MLHPFKFQYNFVHFLLISTLNSVLLITINLINNKIYPNTMLIISVKVTNDSLLDTNITYKIMQKKKYLYDTIHDNTRTEIIQNSSSKFNDFSRVFIP